MQRRTFLSMAVTALSSLSLAESLPKMDWEAEPDVNGIHLGDTAEVVYARLGPPRSIQLCEFIHEAVLLFQWEYAEVHVMLLSGRVVAVMGTELGQNGKILVRQGMGADAARQVLGRFLSSETQEFQSFSCRHFSWFKFFWEPVAAKVAVRVLSKDIASVSLFEEQYFRSDLSYTGPPTSGPPDLPALLQQSFAAVTVAIHSTAGDFALQICPQANPEAAERMLTLVRDGFYDDSPFFQVSPGFACRFGINSRPQFSGRQRAYLSAGCQPVPYRPEAGTVALLSTALVDIALQNLQRFPLQGHTPIIGIVSQGMHILNSLQPKGILFGQVHEDLLWENDRLPIEPRGFPTERIVSARICS